MKEKPSYTIISEDTIIQGNVKVKGNVMIAGIINGDINAGNSVRIAQGGKIKGNVKSKEVYLNGEVTQGITAQQKVELGPQSILTGDLISRTVVVKEGAKIMGKCEVSDQKSPVVNK
ncbi:MAG: polymer-forming cytoskeletal protein [Candidatus Marinimicrobia bacterium]|nr:polymer-forming cytoskeletal protein [Candidatus Neomarinimicrobiota bacterium]